MLNKLWNENSKNAPYFAAQKDQVTAAAAERQNNKSSHGELDLLLKTCNSTLSPASCPRQQPPTIEIFLQFRLN